MPKYYVEFAGQETVLTAADPQAAAMAVADPFLQPHAWVYDDPGLAAEDCQRHLMIEALLHLPTSIRVSERGFGRQDAAIVGVPETVQHWHRLMIGMRRLFVAAGIAPASIARVGGFADPAAAAAPRLPR